MINYILEHLKQKQPFMEIKENLQQKTMAMENIFRIHRTFSSIL